MAHSHHMHREHQVSHRRVHHILKDEPDGAKHHSHSHAFSKVTSKTAAEHHDGFVAGKRAAKRYARGGKVRKAEGGGLDSDSSSFMSKSISDPATKIPGKLRNPFGYGRIKTRAPFDISGPTPVPSNEYARGGKVKGKGHQTNIAIVIPHHGGAAPPPGGPAGMPPAPPMAGPPGGAPGGGPPMPPGAGGPPGMPPGMPMRARGGRVRKAEGGGTPLPPSPFTDKPIPSSGDFAGILKSNPKLLKILQKGAGTGNAKGGRVGKAHGGSIDGESTKANLKAWGKHASSNSYFRGGAATGVGREEKAEHQRRK